jgi:hypothetical protein
MDNPYMSRNGIKPRFILTQINGSSTSAAGYAPRQDIRAVTSKTEMHRRSGIAEVYLCGHEEIVPGSFDSVPISQPSAH